jgi:hypothetical protein
MQLAWTVPHVDVAERQVYLHALRRKQCRHSARSTSVGASTLPAAPPVSCDGRFKVPSSRCEAAASSRRWVLVDFTESSIQLRRRLAPPPPKPHNGQEVLRAIRARNGDSTAPFGPESQFFLDHLVAGFRPNGSWSDPHQAQYQRLPMEVLPRAA